MKEFVVRELIAISSVGFITLSVAVIVVAVAGRPIRVEYTDSNTHWVAEINRDETLAKKAPID